MKLTEFENQMNAISFTPLYDADEKMIMKVKLDGHFNYQIVGIDSKGYEHPYGIISKYYTNKFTINFCDDYTDDNLFYDAPEEVVRQIMKLVYKFTNTPIEEREPRDLSEYRIEQSAQKNIDERNDYLVAKRRYLDGDFDENDENDDFDEDPNDYEPVEDDSIEDNDEKPSEKTTEGNTSTSKAYNNLDDLFKDLFQSTSDPSATRTAKPNPEKALKELDTLNKVFVGMLGEAFKNSSEQNKK